MKKALSLFLVAVMVALMIPFSAFMTSAAGETAKAVTSPVELDETKYDTLYSVDFSKVTNAEEFEKTGWKLKTTNSSVKDDPSVLLNYNVDGGLDYYITGDTQLTANYAINSRFNYVIDYTVKLGTQLRLSSLHFQATKVDAYGSGNNNNNSLVVRGKAAGNTFAWDNSKFATDASYATLKANNMASVNADAAIAATDGSRDIRFRIFVLEGKCQYVVIDVPEYGQFYLKDDVVTTFSGNRYFSFQGADSYKPADNPEKKIIIKSFKVHTYTGASKVELDENAYSPIYSVDFSKINNAEELAAAGWTYIDNPGDTQAVGDKTFEYGLDGGLAHAAYSNNLLTCTDVAFSKTCNYVVDYTYKMTAKMRAFTTSFVVTDPTTYPGAPNNNTALITRGPLDGDKMGWDSSTFRSDSSYASARSLGGNLKGINANAAKAVLTDRVDVRVRIFVIGGVSQYVVMDVPGYGQFYVLDDVAINIAEGSYFSFSGWDAYNNGERRIILKEFSVYEYGANVAAASEKACVSVNGVDRYVANGATVNMAQYATDVVAMTTNGVAGAVAETFTAVAGNVYAPITKADIEAKELTAAGAELRLGSNPGIRFKTAFAGNDYAYFMGLVNESIIVDVKMGTLVTVDTYLAEAGALTAEALKAYGESVGKTVYMDITADAANLYAENTFAGSVIGVKAYDRNYVAASYVTLTFSNGTTVTLYSEATTASVVELAKAIVAADYAGYTTDAEKAAIDYLATYTAA